MKLDRRSLLHVGIGIFLLYLAIHYWDVAIHALGVLLQAAFPLALGAIAAYIANILMSFYERHLARAFRAKKPRKWLRPVCMILAFLTVMLVIFLIIRMVVPELRDCLQVLISALPKAVRALADWLEDTFNISGLLSALDQEWQANQDQLKETITKGVNVMLSGAGSVMNVVVSATSGLISGTISLFLALVFAIHLLAGKERLSRQLGRLASHFLPANVISRAHYFLHVLNESFHSYIVCQCTEAVILGALCALGMLLFQFPYALMIGSVIGMTALIPMAGAYIGGAVGFIMIFSVSPIKAVLFIVYLVILQQLENNLVYPRVVGSSLGLPGVWVLAAVTVGGGLMGITGMLLGVPLTAAIYRILREKVNEQKPAEPAPSKAQ